MSDKENLKALRDNRGNEKKYERNREVWRCYGSSMLVDEYDRGSICAFSKLKEIMTTLAEAMKTGIIQPLAQEGDP